MIVDELCHMSTIIVYLNSLPNHLITYRAPHSSMFCILLETHTFFHGYVDASECHMRVSERTECGYVFITREDCNSRGCCFDESVIGAHSCFLPTSKCDAVPFYFQYLYEKDVPWFIPFHANWLVYFMSLNYNFDSYHFLF